MTATAERAQRQIWPSLRAAAPVAILFVVLALVAPAVLSDFRLNLLAKFLCYAILAIGIDLAWGYTGMLSLGHGVWFGLGGYAIAVYMKIIAAADLGDPLPDFMTWSGRHELPWFWKPFDHLWFTLPAVAIVPGVLAFALGLLVFRSRVKGAYFSIITQALALSVTIFIIGNQDSTGGTNGLTSFSTLFGQTLVKPSTQHLLYYITVGTLAVTLLFAMWMTRSPLGRLMIAIRDDEDRVRFAGYNVTFIKATVFAVSAAMAGVAGALFTPQVGIISPANMDIVPSIEFVLLVAVGGRGTLLGPIVGALVVGYARSLFSESFPATWQYLYGALFVGAVVLFPAGIVGTARRVMAERSWERLTRRAAAIPAPAIDVDTRSISSAKQ